MDISTWLSPISEESPCGADMEYDIAFLNLQESLKGKPEQQYGDTIIPSEAPDWKHIVSLCESLLSQSKDLRVISALTQAWTAMLGLPGLSEGCRLLFESIDRYWEPIFPSLDDDGEQDPFFRVNALGLLSSPDGVIKQIRQSRFIASNLNNTPLVFKDVEMILDGTAKDENIYPGGHERLLIDLKVAYDTEQENIIALRNTIDYLEKIDQLFVSKLGSENKVGFDVILKPFRAIYSLISTDVSVTSDTDISAVSVDPSSNNGFEINNDSWRKLNLKNRSDVSLVLEKICVYFETVEPSHPAPLLIRRIQRLMNLNFYDIIKDVSPDSIAQIELLIGSRGNSDNAEG